jgi:hypothetical protein
VLLVGGRAVSLVIPAERSETRAPCRVCARSFNKVPDLHFAVLRLSGMTRRNYFTKT